MAEPDFALERETDPNGILVDAEFKALCPPLSPDEFKQLEENVLADGCRDPLVIWQEHGILLDGHNRLSICRKHNLPFDTTEISLPDRDAAADWIDRNQLGRRNLTPDQFRLLVGRRYNRMKRQGTRTDLTCDQNEHKSERTAEKLAREHGIAPATVRRAAQDVNLLDRHPEQRDAVLAGEKTIPQAKKAIRKERQAQRQVEAVAKVKDVPKLWTLTHQQNVIQCHALITDPPYGILNQPWEPSRLEAFTREWLKRWSTCGADLVAIFWSQRYLFDGRKWFDEELSNYRFQQLLVWHYANNKSPQSRMGFKQTWEPIFLYRKNGCDRQIVVSGTSWGDGLNDFDCHVAAVPQSNFNGAEEKVHPAQKPVSVFRWLINATTQPGEIVCDPFSGSGTSGIAAVQLKRYWHGIETDPAYLEAATGRLVNYAA